MLKWGIIFTLSLACHGLSLPSELARTADLCQFFAYTRGNPRTPEAVLADKANLENSAFLKKQPTVILIHGHGGSASTSLNPIVKDALLTAENVNVIAVDWSIYASLSYTVAVGTVPVIAESLAKFITALGEADITPLDSIHVVGFNLGAHIAGIAGRSLNRIARITGLDPSGSQWGINSPRLRVTDANYVEVIHTDGSGPLSNGLGVPIGHVDFFANGGSNQPGCFTHTCYHNRAYELFAASFVNADLIGYPCASNLQLNLNMCKGLPLRMGTNDLRKIGSGTYRINTRRSFPF